MNREADRIRQQLNRKLISARHRIELNDRLKVDLPSTNLPQSKTVLRITDVTYGFEADQPLFANFSMRMTGPERIALVGPNGSGKTTLIALITGSLLPWNGTLEVFCPFAVLDQSVGVLDADSTVRENFLRLNPQSTENECRAALARFKFPSDAALQLASTLSGGELLRAGLACVIGGPAPPPLLILDEPTNHLDLESLENIESGLEKYDGGLLVVSHDLSFLESISMTREVGLSVKRS